MDCGVFTVNRIHLKRAIGKWRKRSFGYRQLSLGYNELSPTYSAALGEIRPNDHPEHCGHKETAFSKNASADRNPAVTVVVGKERRIFKVDLHILQDRLFQSMLQRPTTRRVYWDQNREKENRPGNGLQTPNNCTADNYAEDVNGAAGGCIVLLDCDAILFEHVLWLVYNDDPSVPHLNLEELMDFYAQDGA